MIHPLTSYKYKYRTVLAKSRYIKDKRPTNYNHDLTDFSNNMYDQECNEYGIQRAYVGAER